VDDLPIAHETPAEPRLARFLEVLAGRSEDLMSRIIFFMPTSLDGFFEGPDGGISWHHVDEEFNEFAIEQLNSIDTPLFGRVTYEGMASYWPTPTTVANDPVVAEKMNSLPKIVFSKTLSTPKWQNTRLIKENFVEEITRLKQQAGKDVIIFGSSDMAVTFIEHDLIDEFRIMVNPVALGGGTSLFKGLQNKLELKLLRTKTFTSGNVLLHYEPAKKWEVPT
jgi:dihydrofolate reductase